MRWREGFAVLVNTSDETALARAVAIDLLGQERTLWPCPAMTSSEDFAFMLERVAGSYIFIGNGDGDSPGACMVHNPAYDFNDDNIAVGTAFWVRLTERFLPVM